MANTVEYIYQIQDQFSRQLKKFNDLTQKATQKVSRMGDRMQATGDKMQNMSNAIGGAVALEGMRRMLDRSVQVEDALADLVRVGGLTSTELGKMETSMEALSEELGKDKIGLLQQGFEGLKMGIPLQELDNFVKLSARTAVAFDIVDQEAGRSLGSLRAKLGLTTDDLGNLMDSVNFVADNFAADGSRMVNIIERTSGVMKTLQMPTEVIAGLAGFADQVETSQELAASGLNQMFAIMQKNPKLVKQLMSDPVAALKGEFERFQKIDPARRFAVMQKQYGTEAARFMGKAVANVDLFTSTLNKAASQDAFGSMMREMSNRADRTSTFISILWQVTKNTFEAIGDILKPTLRVVTQYAIQFGKMFKAFVNANPVLVKIVAGLGAFVAAIALVSLPLGIFISTLGAVLSPAVAAVAAFTALAAGFAYVYTQSAPLQEFMAGLWGNIKELGSAFGELFVALGGGQDAFSDMSGVIEYLGMSFELALTPLKIMIQLITTAVGLVADLINLDLGSALSRISGATTDIGGTIGGAFNTVSDFFSGETQAENVAVRKTINASNSVTVGGEVRVKAEPGTKVTQTNIGLNGGNNVAMAY